ncbi:FUSC family protein [Luteimonas sp. MC1825]|uniref:FUSC family protein n=1 Tax=Luteimonas sp. MC1825 TaxID=2761107 RepID=UPI001615C2EE|nr:FUSC family protein [Luteimonas sp. MC1825]MBB6598822.1 FUSC family protein [Luteimonas sp. MC1825]QOC88977.1 FUSC family protein [Luteimonas sp. MC1825]
MAAPILASLLRGMSEIRPAPPDRVRFALRAAGCMGAPILVGWIAGDTSAGLMASIGGFTALYGDGRAYLHRAAQLASIAVAFALATCLGLWAAPDIAPVVAVVALVAMAATWIGNALRIGPPGAYMFALACAAATSMPAGHLTPLTAGLLVGSGGLFAWVVHMSGALFDFRGPERKAVAAAGKAVAAYLAGIGTPGESSARQQVAFVLQNAWSVLVDQQPVQARGSATLGRLRTVNRELHLCFAEAMGAASRGQVPDTDLMVRTSALRDAMAGLDAVEVTAHDAVPLGHPRASSRLREALAPGSDAQRIVLRVGIAAVFAGTLGAWFAFERAYWAVAAAVLMLHQGFDWLRMLQRSLERLLGTWIGLLLAGVLLWLNPQGLWLVLAVMALQFTIEMVVMRNYALAVVFITAAALTIASGGRPVEAIDSYLLARGVDTLAGCAVALAVFRVLPPQAASTAIPARVAAVLRAIEALIPILASGAVTTPAARRARDQVLQASFAVVRAHEQGLASSRLQRRAADEAWPTVAATERLAYRALSACWALERLGGAAAAESAAAMFDGGGEARLRAALATLAVAVTAGHATPALPPLPHVLEAEVQGVRACMARQATPSAPAAAL